MTHDSMDRVYYWYLGQWDFAHRLTGGRFTSELPRLPRGLEANVYEEQIAKIKAKAVTTI